MAKKGQRGKKECPSCGELVGARSRSCECGHEFKPKTKPATNQPTATEMPPVQKDLFGDDVPASVRKARELADKYAKRVTLIEDLAKLEQKKKDLKEELSALEKELNL